MDAIQRTDIRAPVAVSAWIPSAAIVPVVDALALLAAAAITNSIKSSGGLVGPLAFAVIAWIVLNAGGWRYPRINPRLGGDVIWIVARLAILSIVLLHLPDDKLDPAITVGISAAVLLPSRAVAYALLRSVRRRGHITEPSRRPVGSILSMGLSRSASSIRRPSPNSRCPCLGHRRTFPGSSTNGTSGA